MHRIRHSALAALLMAAAAIGLSACGRGGGGDNLVQGKTLFVSHCGSCHQLARANTKGVIGPNLDDAFRSDRKDGMTADTVKGVVIHQIGYPRRGSVMPAHLVKGSEAEAVAAYVGQAAGIPGKDTGQLATAGQPKTSGKPAVEKGGKITIDAVDGTAFSTTAAKATAGKVTFDMPNKSALQHNIALKNVPGAAGKIISQGATSTFTATLKPGKYTFYCQVPGHEAAGMKGTLLVK